MPKTPTPKAISSVMAHFGRIGGLKTSAAKTAAVRANGKLGGRPKKQPESAIKREADQP